ncbi:MAG: hypothetical protein IT373_21125 [Polyangiaceae bacterium]|nr:hypothetical protein [Polyangiaceae bacterium]
MKDADGKHRLPVLKGASPAPDEPPPRPPWHWVVLGAVGTLLAWLPLAWVGGRVTEAVLTDAFAGATTAEDVAALVDGMSSSKKWLLYAVVVGMPGLALGFAAVLGGLLVGRFGGAAGKKEATLAGVAAALLASVVVARGLIDSNGFGVWLGTAGIIAVIAGASGHVGGALGLRLRRRAQAGPPPAPPSGHDR